jgi:hypothetical protein
MRRNCSSCSNVSRMLAERIAVLADKPEWQGAVDQIARKGALARTSDAVREVWINAILSGPKTHVVNMMSNSAVVGQSILERAVAGRFADVFDPVEGVRLGEATAMLWGIREGLKDAFVYMAKSAATGESGYWKGAAGADKTQLESARTRAWSNEAMQPRVPEWIPGNSQGQIDTMLGKGVDMLGTVITLPGRALGASDEFFKSINYRAELWAQSYRQAMEEVDRGTLPKEGLKQRIADLVADPDDSMRLKAQDMAYYNTFNTDAGPVADWLMKGRDKIPGAYFVLPFIRTPANIFKFTFERTPIAPIMSKFRADFAAGGARRDMALAKMGVGTAFMMVAFDLAMDGHITGSGPQGDKNASKRQAMTRGGWQRYSFRVQTGERADGSPIYRYYAYNRMDPVGNLFGMAAELAEYARNTDPERVDSQYEEIATATIMSAAQNMMDKAMVRGVSDAMAALRNPERYGESYFTRLASSFVPTGVKEAAQFIDPVSRHTYDLISALKARTPGLSKDLPPRLNFWGDEMSFSSGLGETYDAVSPIYSRSTEKAQPADREFFRLNYFPTHQTYMRVDGRNIPLRNMPEAMNRKITLTSATKASELLDNNRDELKSNIVRRLEGYGDMTLLETINGMVDGSHPTLALEYQSADDDEKVQMIRDAGRAYGTAARAQVLREYPRIRQLRESIPERSEGAQDAPF